MLRDYEIVRKPNIFFAVIKLLASGLALYCIVLLVPTIVEVAEATRVVEEDSVKIRVIANSNTDKDQQIKQEVAESLNSLEPILMQYERNEIKDSDVYNEVSSLVEKDYPQLDVSVSIGDNLIPPKLYLNSFYPQDSYNSIVLKIGNGRGDNFFCSIFPSICKEPEEEEEQEEEEVRFVLWDWFKGLWS
ncbi:stage II sporulation protein R [Lysinibacillus sp. 54212]|uniref:stage II sporulation protein R n=1 Tax=Lysinibacillus sp. 54212 TaxID=3119829 RepID=UPI002FCB55F9